MIELTDITKTFRVARRQAGLRSAAKALFSRERQTVRALDGVSFTIADGESVGCIGPNGAGKSTAVKIMCGVLAPDSGECVINGRVPWRQRKDHVAEIGVVFGQRSQLWWDVPVIDSFELIRGIYRVERGAWERNLEELTSMLDLGEALASPARTLSLGERMRCEIAASLLHNPRILFLDEPTIGLDAVSKIAVRGFLRKLNRERGTTVIMTSHDMQDMQAVADRILLVGRGRILLDGSVSELERRSSNAKTLTVEYSGPAPVPGEGMTLVSSGEGRSVFTVPSGQGAVSEAIAFLARQTGLTDVTVTGASAEEMAASLYREYRI